MKSTRMAGVTRPAAVSAPKNARSPTRGIRRRRRRGNGARVMRCSLGTRVSSDSSVGLVRAIDIASDRDVRMVAEATTPRGVLLTQERGPTTGDPFQLAFDLRHEFLRQRGVVH